jgi:dinuclear metal center YbgI/SA1388 family protein
MDLRELTRHLDELLDPQRMRDYGPNGLQVEGLRPVRRVATGVTASRALLERARDWEADAVVVHHGLFWRSPGTLRVERSLRQRLALLLDAGIALLAYHLPLDRHPELGNNAVLARRLGAEEVEPAFEMEGEPIGLAATLPEPVPVGAFVARIAGTVSREPLVVGGGPPTVRRVGVVTGGAARQVEEAVRRGLDLFLTGEPSEPAVHLAREEGIHFVAAGHHATERFGVQAIADHLQRTLDLETRYIEVQNPV